MIKEDMIKDIIKKLKEHQSNRSKNKLLVIINFVLIYFIVISLLTTSLLFTCSKYQYLKT